jgi:hypothetical protein
MMHSMIKFIKDGGLFLLLYLGPAFILGTIAVPINWISYQLTSKLVWK